MIEKIKEKITKVLPDAEVLAHDPDGRHFEAIIVSESFVGMPLVKQHQLVLNALKEEMSRDEIHAVALKTYTPAQWQERRKNHGSIS